MSTQLDQIAALFAEGNGEHAIANKLGITRHEARKGIALLLENKGAKSSVTTVPVASCRVSAAARVVRPFQVEILAKSIEEIGLIQPIVVRKIDNGYEVIAGVHRLSAFRQLVRSEIPAIIRDDDDLHAELALIDENLIRNELTAAERAIAIARRKAIYEALHPATTHGGDRKSTRQLGDLIKPPQTDDAERFTKATSKAVGASERSIQRDATRGETLGEETLVRVVDTSLDNGEELDALAKIAPERRSTLIERAAAGEKVSARIEAKKEARAIREKELGVKQQSLPRQKFGVIVADPEWRFEPWSRESGMDRAADNHYPTSCTEVIAARDVPMISADDCVLFLWATVPMLPQALMVMGIWGFNYRSHVCWVKTRDNDGHGLRKLAVGTGYWFRNAHELLLVGIKGKIPAPAQGDQWCSAIDAPISEHSAKPECFLEMIEEYFPTLPKIELNRRGPARPGWSAWGFEAQSEPAAGDPPRSATPESAPMALPQAASGADSSLDIPEFLRREAAE